ncbi:biotin-dependent carboxyltransferase family protein [Paraburkholderia sp. IMGN_8]|uniref:5-oxoprolinase subunit C family protein n=1 Tax=Paraburkholderia sp. IMGN_8 TaxID=3136564 RepID=UPI003100C63E
MSIEVIKPGALSTFQDLGRVGHQHLGIPVNGVMDERAHRLANALVGNAPVTPTLEITLMGPTLRFHEKATIAFCGGNLDCQLDGQPLFSNCSLNVPAGCEISFGDRHAGLRTYLAVRGGFSIEPVMGSTSTFARGGYGGHAGRPLKKGDMLFTQESAACHSVSLFPEAVFAEDVLLSNDAPIRITPGREWRYFTANARRALEREPYRITAQSDRMGYRLQGPGLSLIEPREMASEAVGFGAIQVPADGQPIVLMADRQTTGGYPKIAHVCTVDLPRLAQQIPGDTVRFELVDLVEAQRLLLSQERSFAQLEQLCRA